MIKINNISGKLEPPNSDSVYVCEKNNIEIGENEYIAIVGESGSGKSQFVKTISGLNEDYFKLTNGSLQFQFKGTSQFIVNSEKNTEDVHYTEIKKYFRKENIYGRKIGMMFQNPSTCFNPFWNVGRHFDEIKRISQNGTRGDKDFDKFKIRILHTLFSDTQSEEGMEEFLNKTPNTLSGGQKQRLIIALVIIRSPDLIIGDEIGTGIDLKIKKDIHDLFNEFRTGEEYKFWNPSLILISHDIGFAYQISDKILVMYGGTIVQKLNLISETTKEKILLRELLNPQFTTLHPYTRALFESVKSRTFSLVNAEPPNLTKKNEACCPYNLICNWKPDDDAKCKSSFVEEIKLTNNNSLRCVRAESGIEYKQIDDSEHDWKMGWEHEKRKNNAVILEIKIGGHSFGDKKVLNPYDKIIQLKKNEILGLVGESGSGKTTLGKVIIGYPGYSVQDGTQITYFNEDGKGFDYTNYKVRKTLGYPVQIIHQDPQFSLNPNMTIKQSLLEAIEVGLAKENSEFTKEIVDAKLEKYRNALAFTKELLQKKIQTMSGGQQRRLGIGRVFALKPRVIIADEPVASLDSIIKNGIFQLFTYDSKHQLGFLVDGDEFTNTAMILISHDLKSVDRYCSRMLVMEKGYIREEVFNRPGPGFDAKKAYTKELYKNYEFFNLE